MTAPHWRPYTEAMPHTRRSIFPVLLPLVILVPIAAALSILVAWLWHGRDVRQAAVLHARAEVRLVGREMESAVRARHAAAGSLARSAAIRAWLEQGGAPGEEALREIEAVSTQFPDSTVLAASAVDTTLFRAGSPAGSPAGSLEPGRPSDAWYFALVNEKGAPRAGSGTAVTVHAAAAVRQADRFLGAVAVEASAAELAGEAATAAEAGAIVALTNEVGAILHLAGAAGAGARTISDIFPGIERRIFIAAMESPSTASGLRLFGDRAGGVPVVIAAARLAFSDWRVFVAVPVVDALPVLHLAAMAALALAALALLLLWVGLAAAGLRRAHAEELAHEQWKLREAAAGLEEAAHLARQARAAIERLTEGSRRISEETRGASAAAVEARSLLAHTQEALAERGGRLALAAAAVRETSRQAAASQGAAGEAKIAASRAEEELARLIPSADSTARAAARIKGRVASIGALAEKARLLALNASVDASRGGDGAKRLPRVVEEIQGLAGQAAENARTLASECSAAARDAEAALASAEEAGRAAHAAARGAQETAASFTAIVATAHGVPGIEVEDGSAPGQAAGPDPAAALADRTGSALEGLTHINARVAAALPGIDVAAAEAADACDRIAGEADSDPQPD